MEHLIVNKTTSVFGGTGFLGRRIVERLSSAGWAVRAVARRPAELPPGAAGPIEVQTADIRDDEAVAKAVSEAQAVVNAVSLYVETRYASFENLHVESAERLAYHARLAGAEHLVHISGIGADPRSPSRYIAARGLGEQRVTSAFPGATILRPSVLFGPGDAFLHTLDRVARLPVIPLFGTGRTRLQPVHVDDVASAVTRVLERPEIPNRIFELGGSRVYTFREILELVLAFRRRRRPQVPVPFGLWKGLAGLASLLPTPPLTIDQVRLMQADNIVGTQVGTFADLGIEPASLEERLADCLPAD